MTAEPDDKTRGGRAAGGIARAAKLSASERSRIAREAAEQRWSGSTAKAICGSPDKPIRIGDIEIECYVLDDGTRVLTQATMLQAIGRHRRASGGGVSVGEPLPPFLGGQGINPFVPKGTAEASRPIDFTLPQGGRARGYNAQILPIVCEVYLAARQAGELPSNQKHVAERAEILVRGLARLGIIALVDEATGYQELRAKNALAKILETFIDQELQAYVQTFPEDFYRELFRLRGLNFPESTVKRPQYFGHLTNDMIYKRLAPGVLEELKRVQRRDDTGRPKDKLFQRLTQNHGYPKLREHLGSVVTIMKLSRDWTDFRAKLERIHPLIDQQLSLVFDIDDSTTGL